MISQVLAIGLFVAFLAFALQKRPEASSEAIRLNDSISWRGLSIVMIMYHHFALNLSQQKGLFFPFQSVGFLASAIFFFISAYGLAFQEEKTSKQMLFNQTLLRCIKIFVPAVFAIFCYWFFRLVTGKGLSLQLLLQSFMNLRLLDSSMWFIYVMMGCYVVFAIVSFFGNSYHQKQQWLWGISVLYIVIALALKVDKFWFDSILAFPFGYTWYGIHHTQNKRVISFKQLPMMKQLTILSVLFLVTFGIGFMGDNPIVYVLRCLSSLFFLTLLTYFNRYYHLQRNDWLIWVGQYAFALYLIHGKVLRYLHINRYHLTNEEFWLFLLASLLLARVFHKVTEYMNRSIDQVFKTHVFKFKGESK